MASSSAPILTREGGGTLILSPGAGRAHSATVILMHGLGDSAQGWIGTVKDDLQPALPWAKFILPTAHEMPVTVNGGAPMPAWYDIVSLSRSRAEESCDGIAGSVARIEALVKREVEGGVPPARIVLAGFSQGGALSLFTGMNHAARLAGIVVMSGYMPRPGDIAVKGAASAETPIWMGHGSHDAVVPLDFGADAFERAKGMGFTNATFQVYRGLPHSINEEELADVCKFLKKVLPEAVPAAAAAAVAVDAASGSVAGSGAGAKPPA